MVKDIIKKYNGFGKKKKSLLFQRIGRNIYSIVEVFKNL